MSSNDTIGLSKTEHDALSKAIEDRMYNLYSVIERQEDATNTAIWLEEIYCLEKIKNKITVKNN